MSYILTNYASYATQCVKMIDELITNFSVTVFLIKRLNMFYYL